MLPSELLMHRLNGETVVPKRLKLDDKHQAIAIELIAIFENAKGGTQSELDRLLQELEGDTPDYRVKRGLAHILKSSFSTFEIMSPLEPQELRRRIFELSAQVVPSHQATKQTLIQLADKLTEELKREVLPSQITTGLYADLMENRILTEFESPTPEALIHRYNLSQVQGIFYRASHMTLKVHRNDPGEYKLLFRYLKLFQLMSYIEGDVDYGFTITVDGATSLFGTSTRYGLAIAKLLPALLHVTKWSLNATLVEKDTYSKQKRTGLCTLDSDCGLVSHYPAGKMYDSAIESSFAERWAELKTEWKLEREVDLIPIPGSVMIPDFRLVHPDGRTYLLEIVGYWRPEYLRKKFSQVRQANCENLILAISERLNLEKAGVKVSDTPALTVWFKDKLSPKVVLQAIE
jgi:predicted nuclease of restriction endonuclease-like RecB superfamily